MKTRTLLFGLALAVAFPGPARPYGLTTGADFLLAAPAARPDALGQAFSAVADDVNTLVYNPAGLGLLRRPEAGYSRHEFVAGVHQDFLALAIPLGRPGVVGLAYQALGTKPFDSTGGDPGAVWGTASEWMVLLGWGRSFGRVQAGVAAKRVERELGDWKSEGAAADLGLRWVPSQRLALAAVMVNAGPILGSAPPGCYPLSWRAGLGWNAVETERHHLTEVTDLLYSRVSREIRWGAGLEYWYRDTGALRAGWAMDRFDSQQEGASFGAGFRWGGAQWDYSVRPFASLGASHRFSGSWRWGGEWLPDVEPTIPRLFSVSSSGEEAWARWRVSREEGIRVEIVRTALDSGRTEVFGPFERPPVMLTGSHPGTLYRVFARSVSPNGRRGLSTDEIFYSVSVLPPSDPVEMPGGETPTPTPTESPSPAAGPASTFTPTPARLPAERAVEGWPDPMGLLRLEWKPIPGVAASGYQIYWRDRKGATWKLNRVPLPVLKAWVPREKVPDGSALLVTAVREDRTELIVGVHVARAPDEWESARAEDPPLPVKVTGRKGSVRTIAWKGDPRVASFQVLFGEGTEGPFFLLGETRGSGLEEAARMLEGLEGYFILVGLDDRGNWVCHGSVTAWK